MLCKPINLSDSEIDRGVEHVDKACNGEISLRNMRGNHNYGLIIMFCGMFQNPYSIAILIIMLTIGNVEGIVVVITQYSEEYLEQRPKVIKPERESIKGFPNGSNSYGDGVSIVDNGKGSHSIIKVRQRMYSTSAFAANEKYSGRDVLSKLRILNGKYFDLYKIICDENFLFGCYFSIKSNSGNMTPGVDGETFDGISQKKIAKLAWMLKNESFRFKPSKRIFIPKANGKIRPLGIPSPMDKIVQKGMSSLLEIIFEPKFSNNSHGFRPKRNSHTALRQIAQWSGTKYAIEGDINGFFDNVDHKILADRISAEIGDQQFIDLYWKLVKAGYVEEGVKRDSILGVPQGGIVSPILSNIYLHGFDLFMNKLIEKHHNLLKDITIRNPKYDKVTRRIQYLRDKFPNLLIRDEDTKKEINTLIKIRRKIPSRIGNETRLRYVRYADDWVVGYYGPMARLKNILIQIKEYLSKEIKIELNDEKTKITNLLNDKGSFLGFYFRIYKPKESKFSVRIIKNNKRKSKLSHNRMWLLLPVDKILDKLNNEGFLKNYHPGSKIIPQAKNNWIYLNHHGILSRYNWLSRGLLNYYDIANNRSIFHLIINFILRNSCAKTLARKLNLSSRKKVFSKFGYELGTKQKPFIKFFTESNFKCIPFLNWPKYTSTIKDPFAFLDWQMRTQTNFWDPCWICGATENIEIHHVKHIRKSNNKVTGFTKIMSRLNRKQILVCPSCHIKIHNGTYDGISLKK
jgi:nicotine oxidoreductase